jgi:hypothetical protein
MSVPAVFRWSVVPGLVALIVLAVLLRAIRADHARPSVAATETRPDASGRVYWGPVVALAALLLARVPEALLLLRLQDLGVAVATMPLLWGALHVVRSAASYPGGRLTGEGKTGRHLKVADVSEIKPDEIRGWLKTAAQLARTR